MDVASITLPTSMGVAFHGMDPILDTGGMAVNDFGAEVEGSAKLADTEAGWAQGMQDMGDMAQLEEADGSDGGDAEGEDGAMGEADEDAEQDTRPSDPACLLCDDGGSLMSCDGDCMRSFHIGRDYLGNFSEGNCNPMDMPEDLGRMVEDSHDSFHCPNCLSKRFTCFSCKREGGKYSKGIPFNVDTVRRCSDYKCGRYYHPRCIGVDPEQEFYKCPLHRCGAKDCDNTEGGIIGCRRCPIAYHEECLPLAVLVTRNREFGRRVWIATVDEEGNPIMDENGEQVGEVERSLIYCMKHPIGSEEEVPPHEADLFSPAILSSWRHHYVAQFPELESSMQHAATLSKQPAHSGQQMTGRAALDGPASAPPSSVSKRPRQAVEAAAVVVDAGSPTPVKATAIGKFRRLVRAAPETQAEDVTGPVSPHLKKATPILLRKATPTLLHPKSSIGVAAEPGTVALQHYLPGSPLQQPPPTDQPPLPEVEEDTAGVGVEGADMAGEGVEEFGIDAMETEDGMASEGDQSLFDFQQDWYWSKEANAAREKEAYDRHSKLVTLQTVRKQTRMPEPYDQIFRKTITTDRLHCLVGSVKMAMMEGTLASLDQSLVKELGQQEDIMRTTLANYLHMDRYSSYGRHFTNVDLLRYTAKRLEVFAQPRDVLVDFSCGANEFVPIFKRECLMKGKLVEGRAFDIITPPNLEDFKEISWFEVKYEHIGVPGENLIIGLNPPYGKNNILAQKFQDHALQFGPRLIVLIVPPATTIPSGYKVLLEDRHTMADKSFYIPGLAQEVRAQWNKNPPSLRIMARIDMYPLTDRLILPQLGAPTRGYQFEPQHFVGNHMQHMQMHMQPVQMQMQPMMHMPMGQMPLNNWVGRMPY